MRRMHFHFQQKRAQVRQTGAQPSFFALVMLLLLMASALLVGAGIIALLVAPFMILAGVCLLVSTLALLCLIGIAKGSIALARWVARWISHSSRCSRFRPSFVLLQILFARMLANWLANWLANHDPAAHPPGASSAHSHQAHAIPHLKGA